MILLFPHRVNLNQGQMYRKILILLLFRITFAYQTNPTPWFCTDPNALDSAIEISRTLPSCLPGYAIDIEDVVYESTTDGTCSGKTLCSLNNKNSLTFACNRKQTCNVEIRHFRFHINSTCGSTVRFFTKYRCLPVIQEQKDYLCEPSSTRRVSSADINLSCERNYRLHIEMALVGISVKQQSETKKTRFKCNKDTYWLCNFYVPDAYRNVCNNQLDQGNGEQCKIRLNDRPRLKGCQYGEISNFSLVQYSCIPGEGILDDLPRVDICSTQINERLTIDRGLLHSPNYPYSIGKYLLCKKQLFVSRESRLRLFMLQKSIEYYHELNIRLLNNEPNIQRTLAKNELFDTNLTNQHHDEIVEIELKTNHFGGGHFLLYFQVDSRISEYAPTVLEADRKSHDLNQRDKTLFKRDWGIVIGCAIGLVLVIFLVLIVLIFVRISKHRRAKSIKYLKSDDDHRQHLNSTGSTNDNNNNHHRHPIKPIQIEHPHLLSSSPRIISTSSAVNDGLSDRESLLKQTAHTNFTNLGNEFNTNQYLKPKLSDERRTFYEDDKSSRPIRDHRETEQRPYRPAPLATPEHDKRHGNSSTHDAPMASTETLDIGTNSTNNGKMKRPQQAPPKIPPPRMDLNYPKPSAPPLHLLQNDSNFNENKRPHQPVRQVQQWNK